MDKASESTQESPPSPSRPSATLTEAQYLEQQAAAAKAAITGAFSELKSDLAKGADPRVWMQSHPWITLASAAVAGFAAAAAAVPSKEQQALRKLEAIERALHRPAERAAEAVHGNGADGESKKSPGGFVSMLLHELIGALKPAIIAMLTARLNPDDAAENAARAADAAQQAEVESH